MQLGFDAINRLVPQPDGPWIFIAHSETYCVLSFASKVNGVYVLKIMNIKIIKFKKFHLISTVNEQGWI